MPRIMMSLPVLAALVCAAADATPQCALQRLPYQNPGLVVDLGVGLWAVPYPVDFDNDGDNDLLVSTADKPYNGIYFFENPGGDPKRPTFKPGVRLDKGMHNTTISYMGNDWELLTPGECYPDFKNSFFENPRPLPYKQDFYAGRANQWKRCDYDGDGVFDLIAGASDWRAYGWDNAFNRWGKWTRGPLHGHVYFIKNNGTNDAPVYANALQLNAGRRRIDVFGCPSPNFTDGDGDGDLDLICGEFLDKLTYFKNAGSRTQPRYRRGRPLRHNGQILRMDLQMLQVCVFDWDKDGDEDLIVGQEDGRVAWLENTGRVLRGMPDFLPPCFFQQEAHELKAGALATPCSIDWDGDGDEDLLTGDTAGYINFIENLDGGDPPRWAKPRYLEAGGKVVRIQAGKNGSIQGPAEAKWGYTVFSAADWDMDGVPDIVLNSIWGEVVWYRNCGTRTAPNLEEARQVLAAWEGTTPKPAWVWWKPKGKQLVTQWRTSPVVVDWNKDGLNDLLMLDPEGYLAFFERRRDHGGLVLLPGKRIFSDDTGAPLRLNEKTAGKSGRRKFCIVDWDGDGKRDILIDSKNIDFFKNVGEDPQGAVFKNMGQVDSRLLAGHDTCPTTADWDRNGKPDLIVGAEDGFFYHMKNPN